MEGREKKCVTAERTTLAIWESVMLKLFNVTCVARSDEHTQRELSPDSAVPLGSRGVLARLSSRF